MKRSALLPWLFPLTLVVAVVVAAVGNNLIYGVLFMVAGYVGVPIAYLAYTRTRRELRDARRPR